MTIFRPAKEHELELAYEVWYHNEVLHHPHPPPPGVPFSYLRHVLQTGVLHVAEQHGEIIAFAGAITRGTTTFLTDLFVEPTYQSGQLGKKLLHTVLLQDDLTHCTVSSSDPRALALYIRAGMHPQWPYFALHLERSTHQTHQWPSTPTVEVIEANPHNSMLLQWDSQICGRPRPLEHTYWIREREAIPLWFLQHEQIIGYGYIQLSAGTIWHPHDCRIGPIGVQNPEHATTCVLAAINWALQHANSLSSLSIDVPGPHPCLTMLLENGFRIHYVDTFVSTADRPFFDAQCYIPSGGDLF